ncbi:IS1634 family transposase [Parablautia intestinalis]|uniref:IS1634 family transposase n=1 Tax=Parablautia intestinalis TaxID=2320100 RepID=UPI002412D4BC|nr:IS1634 family transposase [Parablautia intestinalis]
MAYFLKKTKNKKGIYLQIYESYYDPERKGGAHRSYKPIGYVHELQADGIDDPIAFYGEEVRRLNQEYKERKQAGKMRQISDESPEKLLGYFPLKNLNDSLGCKKYIDLMQTAADFRFSVFDMVSALIYARIVHPCSKARTYDEVIPKLFEKHDFSLDQLYSGLEYIDSEYEKVIEIYNHQVSRKYKFDTSHTYFDCTNFYFEIDKEDDFRLRGPSKENKKEPIVGLGLLLDANQIPVGMKMYPGNESEKPVLRNIIDDLKQRNHISGRTIQVADKGLNCFNNILHALKAGDGYIFSKSVKALPETEKTWVLLKDGYMDIKNKKGQVLYRIKECVDDFPYTYTDADGHKKTLKLPEKRIVTFNPKLAEKQKYEINRQVEKAKKLKACEAKKSEYGDSAKYVTFISADKKGQKTDGKVNVEINQKAIENAKALAGYNMIVTSQTRMGASEIYAAYHNLWRIEESFRVMKSQLDARPVYLQKQDTITGHFLICYLAVLLTRLFQIHILNGTFGTEEIFDFMHDFRVAKVSERKYINLTRSSSFIKELSAKTGLPLTSYFLGNEDINKMLSHRF